MRRVEVTHHPGMRVLCFLATTAALWVAAAAAGSSNAPAAYDPPASLRIAAAASPAVVAKQALPSGARLLHPALALPFGAHERGTLLAFVTADPPQGYAVWYLVPGEQAGEQQLIRLRDPKPGVDEMFDVQVSAVFADGPVGDKHLVLLETFSRPAPAGSQVHRTGSVYRRVLGNAQLVESASQALDGVRDARTARAQLAAAAATAATTWPKPMAARAGGVSAAFLELPVAYVNLTRTERAERLAPRNPWAEVVDEANGYLDIRGDAGIAGYRVALFKRSRGAPLVAVQKRVLDTQQTWFVVADGATWRDVSAQVMPGYQRGADYELPRKGTTVTVGGKAYRWDGTRFFN
jgi:hypothetical protein